jgi:hypothetical protein
LRRVFVLVAVAGAMLFAYTGSALASGGQQLCIGSPSTAVKPASDGTCPHGGDLVTLATESQVTKLDGRVDKLENQNARLEDKVAALEQKLSKITYEPKGLNDLPTVKISGANLQVVNGTGAIQNLNGLGNVIIGYDEHAADIKQTGSHNLVLGDRQTFTSWGGLLAGSKNSMTAPLGVAFGFSNEVKGKWATVTAGFFNGADGDGSSISGGSQSVAKTTLSSISGGFNNFTEGDWASVSGGQTNFARGRYSSMSGGVRSTARGVDSSVSGGEGNDATGDASSILGGHDIAVENKWGTSP